MEEIKTNESNAAKKSKLGILKKAWDWFTTILTLAIVAVAFYCVLGVVNQNKTGELFFPFGYRAVQILSGSMEPALHTGSVVIVQETKDVEEGDIVFFITEDYIPVIHRYIDVDEDGNMITKGDNNPKEDLEPLTVDRIQGKVVKTMNWLSEPMNFLNWMKNKAK